MLSMRAVTQMQPECFMATSPPAVSTSFMIVPPWTFPVGLASVRSIIWHRVISEALRPVSGSSVSPPQARSPPGKPAGLIDLYQFDSRQTTT